MAARWPKRSSYCRNLKYCDLVTFIVYYFFTSVAVDIDKVTLKGMPNKHVLS